LAVADMAEARDPDRLPAESVLEMPAALAGPLGAHHHVIHVVDRFLPLVVAVARGIQRFARFPERLALFTVKRNPRVGRKTVSAAQVGHARRLRGDALLDAAGPALLIELG